MTTFNILHIFIGFIGLIAIAIPFSNNYKIINYRYVFYGIISQLFLAAILLKLPIVINFFELLGNGVTILQNATIEGAGFVFGYPPTEDTISIQITFRNFCIWGSAVHYCNVMYICDLMVLGHLAIHSQYYF